jgi:hypothetical protein
VSPTAGSTSGSPEIAFQTNLLSLNAAVEAASADALTERAREMDRHMQRYRLDDAVPAIVPCPHFSP